MMQQAIDRSAQTGGSFATSVVLHVAALLVLALGIGRQAAEHLAGEELNEIAYIEARYGEDVAKKVKLKTPGPGAGGAGITTDSAVGKEAPAEVAAPEPARPEPAEPQLQQRREPAPTPRPQPRQPEPRRRELAAADAPAVAPARSSRQELATSEPQLRSKATPAPRRRVVDTEALSASLAGETPDDAAEAPRPATTGAREKFAPQRAGLRDRGGRAQVSSGPDVPAATSSRQRSGAAVAEGTDALAGGSLGTSRGDDRGGYQAPRQALAPRGVARGSSGGGVVDVAGPTGSAGGSRKSGRKTILDYGEGSGGGGGSLGGRRGRLAEAPTSRGIVDEADGKKAEKNAAVAEAATDLGGEKGVGMTISGQIAGREILRRVPPEYTARARREGWEGVVAVHFTVLPDGRVKDNVYFEQTSVHRDLNQAAMAAIREFRFAPLPAEKAAVEQWGVITIVFRLR